ncbi:MAG: hypothetical protein ACF8R9_10545 [Phycisphaerales bacterium JB054]
MHGSAERKAVRTRAEALNLLGWAHGLARGRPEDFRLAGQFLDTAYSDASVRDRRRIFEELGETVGGFGSARRICISDDMEGPVALQARLACAVNDLIASPPDMTPLATEDPMVQARLVVLVACLATDRDAGEYCAGDTELAGLDWLDDRTRGRAMVGPEPDESLAGWGLLAVLEEAKLAIELRSDRGDRGGSSGEPDLPAGATLAELVESVVAAECGTEYFLSSYAEAGRLAGLCGTFKREHLPEYRGVAEASRSHLVASEREARRRDGEAIPDVMFVGPDPWEGMLDEYIDAYQGFVAKAEHAMAAAAACAQRGLRTVPALPEHFLLDLGTTLRFILGSWHPTSLGPRGLGAIRTRGRDVREVPEQFFEHLRELQRFRVVLQGVVAVADTAESRAQSPAREPEEDEPAGGQRPASEVNEGSYCFVKRGVVWDVRFGEESGMFGHLDGMTYIHGLLRTPNPVRDLRAGDVLKWKTGRDAPPAVGEPFEDDVLGHAAAPEPLMSPEAISRAKQRLTDIRHDLREERSCLGLHEALELKQEQAQLQQLLAEALGLNRRPREFKRRTEESDRKRVSQAINRCVKKFATDGMPEFADHLRLHLTPSGYRPGPKPPPWSLNGV